MKAKEKPVMFNGIAIPDEVRSVYECATDSEVMFERAVVVAARYWARCSVRARNKPRWIEGTVDLDTAVAVLKGWLNGG